MIISCIALALTKTLASFVFHKYLQTHYESIHINGAPDWYGKNISGMICVSGYGNGNIGDIDKVKIKTKKKLKNELTNILKYLIDKSRKGTLNTQDKILIFALLSDEKLIDFINRNIEYKNIDYKKNNIFIRGCVDEGKFKTFEMNRLKEINNKIVNLHAFISECELDKSEKECIKEAVAKIKAGNVGSVQSAFDELGD